MRPMYMKMFSGRFTVCVGVIINPRYDAAVARKCIQLSLLPDIFTISLSLDVDLTHVCIHVYEYLHNVVSTIHINYCTYIKFRSTRMGSTCGTCVNWILYFWWTYEWTTCHSILCRYYVNIIFHFIGYVCDNYLNLILFGSGLIR